MLLEVVIHVNDRLDYLSRCLERIHLCKRIETIDLLVSCNSTKEHVRVDVVKICTRHNTRVRFSEGYSAHEHFRSTASLSNAEHLILLHDDDYPGVEYLSEIYKLISLNLEAVAFGVDSNFNIRGKIRRGKYVNMAYFKLSPLILALSYLFNRCGPPFPLICYKRSFIVNALKAEPRYGKYSDTVIVLSAARLGLWLSPVVAFTYVMHSSNDSGKLDSSKKFKLMRYLILEIATLLFDFRSYASFTSNIKMLLGRFIKVDSEEKI